MSLSDLLKTEIRQEDIVDWLGVMPSGEKLIELQGILLGLKAYMADYGDKVLR